MTAPLKVDQLLNSDLRPYRIPLLQRISESGRISLTVWHGEARAGIGAPSSPNQASPLPLRPVRNVFWPVRGHRVAWQHQALRILRSEGNVVICTEVIHNLTIWLIAIAHRLFGKGLVLHGHFVRSNGHGVLGSVSAMARRVLHRLADTYIAYTEEGRKSLLAEGIPPERVFVSQNTLDTEALQAAADGVEPEAVDALREELGLPAGPVLLYLGRLIPVKRVDVAVELLKNLDGEVSLVVVGDGFLRHELEELSRGLPIRFRGAIYDELELARYFKLADILVLPGRVGLTCVHGFANGVPCVTTREDVVEQSPEYDYVEHGYNGLILPSDDPATHANAIRDLLEDPEALNRLGMGALETAQRLTMGRMVEEYEDAVLKADALRS